MSGRWSFPFEQRSYQIMKMRRRRRRREGGAEKEVRGGGVGEIGGLMEKHSSPNDGGEQTMRG